MKLMKCFCHLETSWLLYDEFFVSSIYFTLDEFQSKLNLSTKDSFTIVGIQTKKVHDFGGYSPFPWSKQQFTNKGKAFSVTSQRMYVHRYPEISFYACLQSLHKTMKSMKHTIRCFELIFGSPLALDWIYIVEKDCQWLLKDKTYICTCSYGAFGFFHRGNNCSWLMHAAPAMTWR